MNEQEHYKWMVCVRCLTFNHAPYIKDAMNGFAMQKTGFPFVCAIIDDASTDGEQEIIENYLNEHFDLEDKSIARHEETDDYILTFSRHTTNRNCYFAVLFLKYNHYKINKNKLPYLKRWHDKAKYIAICEGDDYWTHSGKLLMQVDFMEKHDNCVFTHTSFDYKEDGIASRYNGKHRSETNVQLLKQVNDLRPFILDGNTYLIQTMTVMFRNSAYRQAIKKIEEFKGKFLMGDTQLWVSLLSIGNLHFFEEVTAVYRLHLNSSTHQPKLENKLRFQLSCSCMRVAMAEKFSISQDFTEKFRRQYNWALTEYLWFDRAYQPIIPAHYNSIIEKVIFRILQSSIGAWFGRTIYLSKRKEKIGKILSKWNPF